MHAVRDEVKYADVRRMWFWREIIQAIPDEYPKKFNKKLIFNIFYLIGEQI